jgi:hypothetical protein
MCIARVMPCPEGALGLSPGLNGAKIRWFRKALTRKGPLGFSPVSAPEPRHRLEAYATLLSGVSSDISKSFLTGVPRAHSHH